jgi:hypothetical protein
MILVRTDHPYLRVGCHNHDRGMLVSATGKWLAMMLPLYFSDRWGQNLNDQTTMCHAPSRCCWRAGGMHSMCYRCFLRWHERIEVLLEVMTLEVTVPLTLALDGDATVFAFTMAVELSPEISHSNAGHWRTWCRWHACH